MSNLRLISGIFFCGLLTACSPKVSKLDYDRQIYEYAQLQMRYELLQKESSKTPQSAPAAPTSRPETPPVPAPDFVALQQRYTELEAEKNALQTAYSALEAAQKTPDLSAGNAEIEKLQREKAELERQYALLESRYSTLKNNVGRNPILAENTTLTADAGTNIRKGAFEEASISTGSSVVKSATFNGLYFEYETSDLVGNRLILDIAVINNSTEKLKTFWQIEKIQMTDRNGKVYIAKDCRIGTDYVQPEKGGLIKWIKKENTVFARFAFEDVPNAVNLAEKLSFVVVVNGEERVIELRQLDVAVR